MNLWLSHSLNLTFILDTFRGLSYCYGWKTTLFCDRKCRKQRTPLPLPIFVTWELPCQEIAGKFSTNIVNPEVSLGPMIGQDNSFILPNIFWVLASVYFCSEPGHQLFGPDFLGTVISGKYTNERCHASRLWQRLWRQASRKSWGCIGYFWSWWGLT